MPPHGEPVVPRTPEAHVAHPFVTPVFVRDAVDGIVTLPAASIVAVAVPPKYAGP